MESLMIFKSFKDGFIGLTKNLVFLLILLGIHLGLSYGIGFVMRSYFPELVTGYNPLSTLDFQLNFLTVLLNSILLLIGFIYKTYLTLLLLTIFFNYHLDMEMTVSEMLLYSFNRIATVLRVILLFLPLALVLILGSSMLMIRFDYYMIYLLYVIIIVGIFFMSFIQHGIVVNEFGARKTIANSFSFVKKHFGKVLIFTILGIGSQFLFSYLSSQYLFHQVMNGANNHFIQPLLHIINVILLILLTFYLSSSMALYCQTVEVVEEDEDELIYESIY